MPATRDGKMWRSQFYYEDWQGVRHKKNKRGFKTKAEAEEWERNFRQQQRKDLDINFENFVEIYFADMENRLRESTIKNKRYVFDLKVKKVDGEKAEQEETQQGISEKTIDLSGAFQEINGCAVIYSPVQEEYSFFNEDMCRQEVSPSPYNQALFSINSILFDTCC